MVKENLCDWKYQQPPPPAWNGGWFTGEPYDKDAPWGTVPVIPDVSFLIHNNLLSAQPPPGANIQYPGSFRPGNNAQAMPGIVPNRIKNDLMCSLPPVKPQAPPPSANTPTALFSKPSGKPSFAKFSYLFT